MIKGILLGFLTYIIVLGISVFYAKVIKKKDLDFKRIGINSLIFLVLFLVLFLIISKIYTNKVNAWYVVLSLFLSIFTLRLNPIELFLKIKNKEKLNKKKLLSEISIIVIVILEAFAFNFNAYKNYDSKITYSLTDSIISSQGEINDDGTSTLDYGEGIYINTNETYSNIHVTYTSLENEDLYVTVYYKESTYGVYKYYKEYHTSPTEDMDNYFDISGITNSISYELVFKVDNSRNQNPNTASNSVTVKDITFNDTFPFEFNFIRVSILILIVHLFLLIPLLIDLLHKDSDRKLKYGYNPKVFSRVIIYTCLIALTIFIIYAVINSTTYFVYYKNINLTNTNIYFRLFDAFKKHQLYLDITPSDSLLALDNPYPYAARSGVSYYWDHAYYNGKYYCYYGAAPVILVMFPIYFLSNGYIPSLVTTEIIGQILYIMFLLLTLNKIYDMLSKKRNPITLTILLIVSLFTGLAFYITFKIGSCYEVVYHIPYAYGLAFCFMYIFFSLKAMKEDKLKWLNLMLAGFGIVFMVASRPTLIVSFLFMIPIYVETIRANKEYKKNLLSFIPMVCVVLIGAILICLYNYKRFDSILEFGQFYQLTITDNTAVKLKLTALPKALFHFFFQPATFSTETPIVRPSYIKLSNEYHTYITTVIGVFFFPYFWTIFSAPFTKKDEDKKVWHYVMPLIFVSMIILALMNYCYAGVCPRYMLDIFPFATLLAFITIIKLIGKFDSKEALQVLIPIITIGIVVTVFISVEFLFYNFDGFMGADLGGLYFKYRHLFGIFNI